MSLPEARQQESIAEESAVKTETGLRSRKARRPAGVQRCLRRRPQAPRATTNPQRPVSGIVRPPSEVQPPAFNLNKDQIVLPAGGDTREPAQPPSKRPLINKKLLQAAERQAESNGESMQGEEHIDWSSASTIAGAMRAQVADGSRGAVLPADLRDELFGDTPQPSGAAAKTRPRPQATRDDLPAIPLRQPLLVRIEESISKRALVVITAVSLIALVATLIGSNNVINSFDEGDTPTLPISSLHVASLAGVWLGLDRSQGEPGVPATFLFTRPNWLIVTEPNAATPGGAPLVVAQANYTLSSNKLQIQMIQATNASLLPSAGSIAVSGNTATLTNAIGGATSTLSLSRPQTVAGRWQASSGGGTYSFINGTLTITPSSGKPQTGTYIVTGDVLRVTPGPSSPGAGSVQTWDFTFDGKDLLLYLPDPNNSSATPSFASPLRLSAMR